LKILTKTEWRKKLEVFFYKPLEKLHCPVAFINRGKDNVIFGKTHIKSVIETFLWHVSKINIEN